MKKTILFFIFCVFIVSCSKSIEGDYIYTSFYPIYFMVNSLSIKDTKVINLLPNGAEPHDFEPTFKEIENILRSKLFILNGLGLESYKDKVLQKSKNNNYVIGDHLDNLIYLDDKTTADPHIWISPKNYIKMTKLVINELEQKGYNDLDKSILEKLENLDKKYAEGLKNCETRDLLTSHRAFAYLSRDYSLNQYSIVGLSPEEEPSSKDIINSINLIKSKKIKYIFAEEFPSSKISKTLQTETGVSILVLNPIETLSSDQINKGENYISIMEQNLDNLKKGLNCK